MKNILPIIIAAIVGFLLLADFFLDIPAIKGPAAEVQDWGVILAAFALALATINLIGFHIRQIGRKSKDRIHSLIPVSYTHLYDWLAHEKEFENAVRKSGSEAAFARCIQEMLLLINNGHTSVMDPLTFRNVQSAPKEMSPWIYQAIKTDIETVYHWYQLATKEQRYPQNISLPFRARYVEGEYVVYWTSDELCCLLYTSRCV